MAVTYRASAADGSSTGTSDRSCAIIPASGDLLLVFCCVAANTNDTPTCDDDNSDTGTYSLISCRPYLSGGNSYRLSCFVRGSLMSNTDETTVTVATGSNSSGVVIVVALAGAARVGTDAILQSNGQSSQAASGTPAPAFSSSAATENLTLTAVGNATTGAPVTAPTDWTERQWISRTSNNVQMSACTRDSGFTGTTITWGGASATEFASHAIEIDGSEPEIVGTLSVTIAAVTLASAGTLPIVGTASNSIGDVTISAVGTLPIVGTLSSTIDPITLASAGTLPIVGTATPTIDDVTLSSAGALPIVGTTNATIDPVTLSATGALPIVGTLSATVDPVTLASTGVLPIVGVLSATIDPVTISATGALPIVGTLAVTISAVTMTAVTVQHRTTILTATVRGAATLSSPVGATVTTTATVLGAAAVTSTVPGAVSI